MLKEADIGWIGQTIESETIGIVPAQMLDSHLIPALPELWFAILLFTLAMYVFLDGFDFGIGLLYGIRTDDTERELLLAAFGPVWDANEVWLVAFGTILLAAFPPVYATLLSDHYLLIFAIIFALLLRGVTPELREQRHDERWQRACDRGFVAGSILSPFFIGMLAGSWIFATGTMSLPAVMTGIVLVTLSLSAGIAYVAMKTRGDFQRDLRRMGQVAIPGYLLAVVLLLGSVVVSTPRPVWMGLLHPAILALVGLSVVLGLVGVIALRRGLLRAAFWSVGALAFGLIAVVGLLLVPTIYPATGLTLHDAVVSPVALNVLTIAVIPMLVLVLFYFRYLYRVFSGPIEPETGYGHAE